MLRKIKRNMARRQLENDGMKNLNRNRDEKGHKIDSVFSMNWRKAYILRFAEVTRNNGKKVEFRRKANESSNS